MLEKFAVASAPAVFVVLWSTGFVGAKYGMPYAEPLTFLAVRMALVVAILFIIARLTRVPWPSAGQVRHSIVTGLLMNAIYLGGVYIAIRQGIPAGISALIPGLQPVLTSTIASRWLGERVTWLQWLGLVLGLAGVLMVLHDHTLLNAGSALGWVTLVLALIGITIGALYQKRHGGEIDWRAGNLIQCAAAGLVLTLGAFLFESREIRWTGEFVFALSWLVVVLSIGNMALMYWLIRRSPATSFASLFYLVPAVTALMAFALFGEKLDAISIAGMIVCAAGVFLVSHGGRAKAGAEPLA